MLITLISIVALVVGIIVQSKARIGTWADFASFGSTVFGGILTIICLIMCFTVQFSSDIEYQNKLYEKQVIEYRIDNMDKNIVGNELLYNDIVKFNNNIRTAKKFATNPWTSWFFNQKVATIDYIEIEGR